MDIDARLTSLRVAASAGDVDAARELGRLLSLLPADPGFDQLSEPQRVHVEPWLRQVLSSRPDDPVAILLLAGRLSVDALQAEALDTEEDADALLDEARALYQRLLDADPTGPHAPAARLGLAELRDMTGDEGDADEPTGEESSPVFSFYLVEAQAGSGSVVADESLVATDPDELRWACDFWLRMVEAGEGWPPDGLTLTVHTDAGTTTTVELSGKVDWSEVPLAPLPGRPLPAGWPARTGSGTLVHYGYRRLVA
jgi:hypothetical protein